MPRGLGLGLGLRPYDTTGVTPASPPVNTVAPAVTGTGYVGYTLTSSTGTWTGSPAPTFTYQWQRSGVDIGGETAATHVVVLADEGVPVRCVVTATNGSGSASANSNAIEQWVPTDAGTVAGWWDAYSPATITIATGISAWASRGSVSGATASQGTAANQPAYGATAWDGVRPCATFDGNDFVRSGVNAMLRNAAGTTLAGVASLPVAGSDNRIVHVSVGGGPSSRGVLISGGAYNFRIAGRRLDPDSYVDGPAATASAVTRLWSGSQDHTNNRARSNLDGVIGSWVSPYSGVGSTSNTDSTSTCIGANGAAPDAGWWNGKIAEALVYASALSDANMDKLHGYLAWRWGVTARLDSGHPFKTTAPTP